MPKLSITIGRGDNKPPADDPAINMLNAQVIASIETGQLPSQLLQRRYIAAVRQAHRAELASIVDAQATLEIEIVDGFVRLLANCGQPVVIDADQKPDFFNELRTRVAQAQSKTGD